MSHLAKLNAQIVFLQETHCNDLESLKLKRQWVNQIVFSPAVDRHGGVAILFHKAINAHILSSECDSNGRWILVDTLINKMQITFF